MYACKCVCVEGGGDVSENWDEDLEEKHKSIDMLQNRRNSIWKITGFLKLTDTWDYYLLHSRGVCRA